MKKTLAKYIQKGYLALLFPTPRSAARESRPRFATNPANDVVVVRQMCLAIPAAVDAVRSEIYVVRKPHDGLIREHDAALLEA
jgi:hypothetical protein